MATFLAHITIREGREADFEALARELHEASHTGEAALLRYEYWRGARPRTYYTLASFEDYQGFITHQASDHHEGAAPALGRVIEDIRLEWVDPIAGASGLPSTDFRPAESDASDLEVAYTERYADVVARWWDAMRSSR